jgi:hypothetical protein
MVVTPFEAIYDVAYTWQQWGGAWNAADAVHFELPGASAEAKRLGAVATEEELPWWYELGSAFLPSKAVNLSGGSKDYKKHIDDLAEGYFRDLGI